MTLQELKFVHIISIITLSTFRQVIKKTSNTNGFLVNEPTNENNLFLNSTTETILNIASWACQSAKHVNARVDETKHCQDEKFRLQSISYQKISGQQKIKQSFAKMKPKFSRKFKQNGFR